MKSKRQNPSIQLRLKSNEVIDDKSLVNLGKRHVILLSLLMALQMAEAGELFKLNLKNPNEPYGCNPPDREFEDAHNGEGADRYSLRYKDWAYDNLPKKKLVTLFNLSGKRIGCLENPNQDIKGHRVIVVAQDFPAEGERRQEIRHTYEQSDLKKIYESAAILKEIPLNDERDIFALRNLHFPEDMVEELLEESGVDELCEQNFLKRVEYFQKQSLKLNTQLKGKEDKKNTKDGKVDFYANPYVQNLINERSKEYLESESLFLTDGIAYNPHDFGNYLWGTAISRACIPCPLGRAAAHVNTLLNLCLDNKSIKLNREQEGKKGCKIEFDSPYDQQAIKNGCHGPFNNKEKSKLSCSDEIVFKDDNQVLHRGHFSYHLASNGTKVLEIDVDGKKDQFVISSDDKGRKVSQILAPKKTLKYYENVEVKYSALSDEQILADVLSQHYPWEVSATSLNLSKKYPVDQLGLNTYLLGKLKVECGSISRFKVSQAKETCLERGGTYVAAKDFKINYSLQSENDSHKKLTLFRKGIFRKKNQQNTKSLSLTDGFQCLCSDQMLEIGLDDCVQDKTTQEKRGHEVKDQ